MRPGTVPSRPTRRMVSATCLLTAHSGLAFTAGALLAVERDPVAAHLIIAGWGLAAAGLIALVLWIALVGELERRNAPYPITTLDHEEVIDE